jgi:A/G-specific adenine glycosylase
MTFDSALLSLARWFSKHRRILPWREEPTPWRVWVSEIMLQQTQVTTVIPFFEKFISRFPNERSLGEAPEDEALLYWAGLGYYSRAKNLRKAARIVTDAGAFPDSREGWTALPGVGDYTAGAILSIAYNQPEPILDANVKRVLMRLRALDDLGPNKRRLWKWADILVKRADKLGVPPRIVNQALMELGALVCKPKTPNCRECVFAGICKALKQGRTEMLPDEKPKEWVDVHEERPAIIDAVGRVLLKRADPGEWRAGLWDLPREWPEFLERRKESSRFSVRYVVTRHRVTREVPVYRLSTRFPTSLAEGFTAVEPGNPAETGIALGSAARKTLRRLD